MRHFTNLFLSGAVSVIGLSAFSGTAAGAVLFHQDFSSSSDVADYMSATPDSSQFHSIAVQNGAGVAINGGLQFTFTQANPVETGGFFRGSLGSGGVMHFSGAFTPEPVSAGKFGPTGHLTFGDFADTSDNTTYNHLNSLFAEVNFRNSGNNLKVEAGGGSLDLPFGGNYVLNVYMNDSGVAQSYIGPDGNTYELTVASAVDVKDVTYTQGSFAVWVTDLSGDGPTHASIVTNAPANTYTHNANGHNDSRVLDSILFDYAGRNDFDSGFTWSEITVHDAIVPEPSAVMLLGLAVPMVMRRRRGR